MNIFYTNTDPVQAANEHCRVHMRKMIVEYAQLLSSAHHVLDGDNARFVDSIYKLSHKNHPCAVWVRQSMNHYYWVYDCAMQLCKLYKQDSGKTHKTEGVLLLLERAPKSLNKKGFSKPPCCTSDDIKWKHFLGLSVDKCYQKYIIEKHVDWRQRGIDTSFITVPKWYTL